MMPARRPGRRAAGICLALLCLCTSALAQARPDEAEPTRAVTFSPSFRLTDVGWDDNVFRVNTSEQPVGDFTLTATPAASLQLRGRRLRLDSQGAVDFVYFRERSDVRSIDGTGNGRIALVLGRVSPYVGGDWASARHRRNFEIDLPVRRVDLSADGGIDVRVSGKTSIGVMTRRTRVDYEGDTVYLGTNLSEYLGATAVSQGARIRYAATPLTTVGAEVERDRNEFPDLPERDSEGFRVTSFIELQPLALVSGRAQVGFRQRKFVDGNAPPFRGTVSRVDIAYTLLGQTRFAVTAQRDLSSSYRADQRDYLQTGVQLGVSHRFAGGWDLGGSVGRFALVYGLGDVGNSESRTERVLLYSAEFGYRLDRTRVGFRVARQTRTSDFSVNRDYEEMRIGSTLSVEF